MTDKHEYLGSLHFYKTLRTLIYKAQAVHFKPEKFDEEDIRVFCDAAEKLLEENNYDQ